MKMVSFDTIQIVLYCLLFVYCKSCAADLCRYLHNHCAYGTTTSIVG